VDAEQHDRAAADIEFELLGECCPVARRRIFARAAMHRAAARELRQRAHYAATGELLRCPRSRPGSLTI
jgi:hypothetical protein